MLVQPGGTQWESLDLDLETLLEDPAMVVVVGVPVGEVEVEVEGAEEEGQLEVEGGEVEEFERTLQVLW